MTTAAAPMTAMTEAPEPRNVVEALAQIMGEMPGIARRKHADGGVTYAFRSIEEIVASLRPLCARKGVVFVPTATITETKDLLVNSRPWTDTTVSVTYAVIHGPSGTSLSATVVGIGRDNSDKGANKATTQALKRLLIQLLMIADPSDESDGEVAQGDVVTPETGEVMTKSQGSRIATLFEAKGFPADAMIRHAYVTAIIGREFESVKSLTKSEAEATITALEAEAEER